MTDAIAINKEEYEQVVKRLNEKTKSKKSISPKLDNKGEQQASIPYEKLENYHSKESVTTEQIEAAKYFVAEEIAAAKEVFGFKEPNEKEVDNRIRVKLVYNTNLSKVVEEYKKESSDKSYQAQQRKNRIAANLKEYDVIHAKTK